ncbi:small nuclear RNA activating complex, polypeptide 3 [Mortierella alpina]|nr:small nuclear RNA activating complex, polypeptide 3 [Mortierella alpina]
MSHAASSSSSRPEAQDLRQAGTSEPLSDETVTSIINVAPQGPLFPILPFGLNFTRLIDEQREHDAYHEYFDDYEQEQEVAARCDVWDDLQDANKFFDDPTLRGLLQEWYDGKLEDCKEPIDKSLRPTWSSIYGQVDEVTEYGDRSNLHLKEHPRPPGLGDENVQRLLGASARGRRRVLSNSDRFSGRLGAEKRKRLFLEEPKPRQMRAKWGRPWDMAPAAKKKDGENEPPHQEGDTQPEGSSAPSASTSVVVSEPIPAPPLATASATVPSTAPASASASSSTAPSTAASTSESTAPSASTAASASTSTANLASIPPSESAVNPPIPTADEPNATSSTPLPQTSTNKTGPTERTDQDDLELILKVSEKRAEEEERVGTTTLEDRFHTQSMAVEDSSLQSLAERNRFEVPVELRPPMNYLGPGPPRFSMPYVPILGPDTIVSIALYSSLNPTKRTQEFLFLGSQPLTAMRDAFHCLSDFVNQGAEDQESPIKNKSDKKISNSFFFIEGVFYTDTPLLRAKIDKRNELQEKERKRLEDLTKQRELRRQEAAKKSKQRSKGKGVARRHHQSTTQRNDAAEEVDIVIDDADLREQMAQTGYKDVPLEQIKLKDEHLYASASQDYGQLFSHRYDDLNRLSYPKPIFKSKQIRHRCRMCNTNPAFYITIDDRLAGETPSYFCEECYDVFHYDEDGNILYDDFKVFLYAHDETK